jgi:hypothetical protein
MTDAGQILIIAAISIMTVISTIIGIQIIFILRDFRKMTSKAHSTLQTIEKFGTNITSGASEFMGFFAGLKNVLTVVEIITERSKRNGSSKK